MSDTTPAVDSVALGSFEPRIPAALADTATAEAMPAPMAPDPTLRGRVRLNATTLRRLRESRLLSQQDMADAFWRLNFRVSIATIKRAETGHAVRFRIAHELARFFGVPVERLLLH